MDESSEQQFFDAAARWTAAAPGDNRQLIDAATQAMVDGLDSTCLVMLASERATADTQELRELLDGALDELHIPRPGTIDQWAVIGPGGRTFPRPAGDIIGLEVSRRPMHVPEVQVLIHINGVEITPEVGQGLHPFDILIPDNLLVASEEPQRIMIAGDEWDYDQQPTIMRDGDTVRCEWEDDAFHPLGRSRAGRPQGAGSAQHRPSHLAGVLLLHRSTLYRSPASGRAWVDPRTRPLTIRDSRRDRAPPTGVPPKSEPVSARIAVHASRPGAGSVQSRRTTHSGAPAELAKAPR